MLNIFNNIKEMGHCFGFGIIWLKNAEQRGIIVEKKNDFRSSTTFSNSVIADLEKIR